MRLSVLIVISFFFVSTRLKAQEDCPNVCNITVPSNITPDGDDISSGLLVIKSDCSFKKYELTIFNRWGVVVFDSKKPDNYFSAEDVEEAVYLWQLKATMCNGNKRTERGYVTVLK